MPHTPQTPPAPVPGPHTSFIEKSLPVWYTAAAPALRQAYAASARAELASSAAAKAVLASVQGPVAFCKPLLQAEIRRRFGRDYDVDALHLVRLVRETLYPLPITRIKDPIRQTLLEAALQNFEPDEGAAGGLDESLVLPANIKLQTITEQPPNPGDESPLSVFTYYSAPEHDASTLKPAEFALMCRELDLGRRYYEHLNDVLQPLYPGLDARDNRQAEIAATLLFNQRDRLECLAHVAMMKGHVSASGYAALLAITGPQRGALTWDGQPLTTSRLFMMRSYLREGTELHGPLLFSQGGGGRCIVYLPDDERFALYEYPSLQAFANSLRERLRDPAYRQAFCRFVSREDVAAFIGRLENVLSPKPFGQFQQPVADPDADLELVALRLDGRPVRLLYDRLLALMLKDAQTLVVPTNAEDRKAREARILKWVEREMLVLNLAAFFLPPVAVVMGAVGGLQLLYEVATGIDDWTHGQTDEALQHVFAVAENLLTLVVVGAGVGAVASTGFIDSLVQVNGPLGKRLWNAQLDVYRQPVQLPAHCVADELGQYHYANRTYVRIEGHFYEQRWDAQLGKWRLRHPRNPNAYEPVLEHNGAGMWRSANEDPAQWSAERTLKRLGHGAERFSSEQLRQIRLCSGLTDQQLRGLDPAREAIPALLQDSLRRFAAARDLAALPAELAANGPLAQQWAPQVLVRLAGWPEDLGLAVDPGGDEVVYGGGSGQDGPRISVRAQDLHDGKLLDHVLDVLSAEQRQRLLGDGVGFRREDQLAALRAQLHDALENDREYWFGELYRASARPVDSAVAPLLRDFPGLAPEVAQEVYDRARTVDRDRLGAQGKVPLAMAEQARLQLREQRVNRALQGLYLKVAVPEDSDVLLLKMAEQLPGWTGQVRVELRRSIPRGHLLATAGDEAAPYTRYIVRDAQGYQAWDDQGNQLSAKVSSAAALLRALPDEARVRLGFDIYQGDSLHAALVARAIRSRVVAAQALGQTPMPGWMRAPVRSASGLIGYELSGRGIWRALFGSAEDNRLKALYPELSDGEREAIRAGLGADLDTALTRLETELHALTGGLRDWVEDWREARYTDERGEERAVRKQDREYFAYRVTQAWRRETRVRRVTLDGQTGHELVLNGCRVGKLPTLTARFDHVVFMQMDGMGMSTDPSEFLRRFPNVELLTIVNNPLRELPSALPELTQLNDLRINGCRLRSSPTVLEPLRTLPRLEMLQFSNSFAELPVAALKPLLAMPRLSHLRLTDVTAGLTDEHFALLTRVPPLRHLSLLRNGLVMTPRMAVDLAGMVRLENLELTGNPLGSMADVASLVRLDRLLLSNTQLAEWPPGLTALMSRPQLALHHVALDSNPIVTVPDLDGVRFFNNLSQFHTTYSFSISRFDLDVASLERFERVGVLPLTPANPRDLDINMPQVTARHLEQLHEMPEAELFLQAWRRVVETRDYELDPINVRRRAWRLLDALCEPQPGSDGLPPVALRQQVFELGDTEMTTCADGMALILSRWESLVLVERVLHLPVADRLRELLRLSRQLFKVALVDARAAVICGRRIARRNALNVGGGRHFVLAHDAATIAAAPALDTLDDLPDGELATPVDVVEVRLKLRILLRDVLDLPLQPSHRMYGANVSARVAEDVAEAVRDEMNFEQMCGWLVDEAYWRRYLRDQHPESFLANDRYWAKGFEYLYEISREAPDMDDVAAVPEGILETLRQRYPDKQWLKDGVAQVVQLTRDEQADLEQWLLAAKVEGEREPYRLLTEPLVRHLFL